MAKLWVFDLLAALVLSVTALAGAYLPVILARNGRGTGDRSLAFVLGNMLSAGVMISAGFCHLLGDAIKTLNQALAYPLAPFLCACGFLMTLVADQIVEGATSKAPHSESASHKGGETNLTAIVSHGRQSSESHGHVQGHCFGAAIQRIACTTSHSTAASPRHPPHSPQPDLSLPNSLTSTPRQRDTTFVPGPLDDENEDRAWIPRGNLRSDEKGSHHKNGYSNAGSEASDEDERAALGNGSSHSRGAHRDGCIPPGQHESHIFEGEQPRRSQVSILTAVLMGVALTFHSLLEGAALGAQQNIGNTLHIFIAIQAHKGLAAYALGSSIVDSAADTRQFWSVICMFSFATPVGIGLGYVLSNVAASNGAAAISSLASGTFLYVAFMEVLPRELANSSHRVSKMGMLLLGFGLMSMLAIWT